MIQLIKFWRPAPPGTGSAVGRKFLALPYLQPARSVCVASERIFHFNVRLSSNNFQHSRPTTLPGNHQNDQTASESQQ